MTLSTCILDFCVLCVWSNCTECMTHWMEQRSHMTIWQCRPWFGCVWSSSERSILVWSGSTFCVQILDNLTI